MGDVTCISSRTTLKNKMFHIENLEELCLALGLFLVVEIIILLSSYHFSYFSQLHQKENFPSSHLLT